MAVIEFHVKSEKDRKVRCEELIAEFDLGHVRKTKGGLLSGGERRRTEIARALASSPSYVLLDEPFAGIDPIAVEAIQRIVVKLKTLGLGVLITDYNVQETLNIVNGSTLLGKSIRRGETQQLAQKPFSYEKIYVWGIALSFVRADL